MSSDCVDAVFTAQAPRVASPVKDASALITPTPSTPSAIDLTERCEVVTDPAYFDGEFYTDGTIFLDGNGLSNEMDADCITPAFTPEIRRTPAFVKQSPLDITVITAGVPNPFFTRQLPLADTPVIDIPEPLAPAPELSLMAGYTTDPSDVTSYQDHCYDPNPIPPVIPTPPITGFTFWFDAFQEALGLLPVWTNRALLAPPLSDLFVNAGGPAVVDNTINGHPAVDAGQYKNSDDYNPTGLFPTFNYTLICVLSLPALPWGDPDFSTVLLPLRPLSLNSGFLGANSEIGGGFVPTGAAPSAGMHIFTLTVAGNWNLYIDGVLVGSSPTAPWALEAFWDLRIGDPTTAVGEIIVYPSALGSTDRSDIEAYLAAKWA